MEPNEGPAPQPTLNAPSNPYKAKRLWPPDFSKMDPKHQFRLERRYRRRTKLAYTRPGWIRGVKLVQYSSILFVAGYSVVYMDWGTMGNPFDGVREWLKNQGVPVGIISGRSKEPDIGRISSGSLGSK